MTDALTPPPVATTTVDALPRRGWAMGLICVSSLAISFGGLIMRNIEVADAWQVNFYRGLSFMAAIATILLIQYRGRTWHRVRRIGRPGLVGGVLLAIAGLAFVQSLTLTTVANALFTLGAIPFFTAALAWVFLREALRPITATTMLIAGAGIVVMVGGGIGGGSILGNLLALLTALSFSAFAVIVRRHRDIDMLPALLVSGLVILAVTTAAKSGDLDIPWRDMALCFVWGGVLSGLANWLFVVASRHLVAAEVTLFMMLEFTFGPLWVWLFIGETPSGWTLAGGALILAAVLIRALIELRDQAPKLRRGRPSPG